MNDSIIQIIAVSLAILFTLYQEIRHFINHKTISPRGQQIKDAMTAKIESDILNSIKNGNMLEHHDIKFEIKPRKK